MRRVEFRLTMHNRGWSGSERDCILIRKMGKRKIAELGMGTGEENSWSYQFEDGWRGLVSARVMRKGERANKSEGFCGYEWMVRSIVLKGYIDC